MATFVCGFMRCNYRSSSNTFMEINQENSFTCPKCKMTSGNDWSWCQGKCPMPMSPHFDQTISCEKEYNIWLSAQFGIIPSESLSVSAVSDVTFPLQAPSYLAGRLGHTDWCDHMKNEKCNCGAASDSSIPSADKPYKYRWWRNTMDIRFIFLMDGIRKILFALGILLLVKFAIYLFYHLKWVS